MAGWCQSGSESDDDEPLNLTLFARKNFGFVGFPKEKEDTLRKIVQQIGATCDIYPKYIFTTEDYFKSLSERATSLYNVSYIRDCVDANRCLSIDQYRFGPKYVKNKDYREFEPCCNNFHNGEEGCIICDPKEVPVVQKETRSSSRIIQFTATTATTANSSKYKKNTSKSSWGIAETHKILDYIVANNLYVWIKSPSLYKRLANERLVKRTPESMRVHFRNRVLPNIDKYDLPLQVKKKFKQIRNTAYPGRSHTAIQKKKYMGKQT